MLTTLPLRSRLIRAERRNSISRFRASRLVCQRSTARTRSARAFKASTGYAGSVGSGNCSSGVLAQKSPWAQPPITTTRQIHASARILPGIGAVMFGPPLIHSSKAHVLVPHGRGEYPYRRTPPFEKGRPTTSPLDCSARLGRREGSDPCMPLRLGSSGRPTSRSATRDRAKCSWRSLPAAE